MLSDLILYQNIMEDAFDRQLNEKLSALKPFHGTISDKIGIENEYLLVDENLKPVTQSVRDNIISCVPLSKHEIGASQIELNYLPTSVKDGYQGIYCHMKECEAQLSKALNKYGCFAVRLGFYPGSLNDIRITDNAEVYQNVLDRYKTMRKKYVECSVGDISLGERIHELIAGGQSSQLNIQVDYNKAISLLNKTIEMSPLFLALSANSPIVDEKHSQYMDIRNIIWKNGYDLRELCEFIDNVSFRTIFPDDYYINMAQYWNDMKKQVYMKWDPEHAFLNNQKMYWKLSRIKLLDGCCLLETRFMSIQPDIKEEIAIHLSMFAILSQFKYERTALIPISFVKENFRRVTKYGINTRIFVSEQTNHAIVERDIKEVLEALLDKVVLYWHGKSEETADLITQTFQKRLQVGPPALEQIQLFLQGGIKNVIRKNII